MREYSRLRNMRVQLVPAEVQAQPTLKRNFNIRYDPPLTIIGYNT
jgi:hypothetical protein